MSKEWKCLCGEWVPDKYPAHMHAVQATTPDGLIKVPGVELWKFERTPERETRDV